MWQTYNFKNYESIVGSFDPKEWVVGEMWDASYHRYGVPHTYRI